MATSVLFRSIAFVSFFFLLSCNKPSPEKYFDVAVLNSNMLVGFAGDGFNKQLESPSMKMGKTKDEFAPMKRSEVVENQLHFVEENYAKVKDLTQTDDTTEIVQASVALYEFICCKMHL